MFAVESFLSDAERRSVKTIFYATNKRDFIEPLMGSIKNYANLKNHVSVWDDFSKFWCFYSLEECIHKLKKDGVGHSPELKNSLDLSILRVFEQIKSGALKYNGSSFINEKIADIDSFELPKRYIVINPCSTDKRLRGRDFTKDDWDNSLELLRAGDFYGVVINQGNDTIPDSNLLIDLSNKTSVKEAVEILKHATGYVGIDTWLSVLAAKLFDEPYLHVKSVNPHCYANVECYYAPKTDFSFIQKSIKISQDVKEKVRSIKDIDPIIGSYSSIPFAELNWCNEQGVMYQRDMSASVEYDKDYFNKYIGYDSTNIAVTLNAGRTKITQKYCKSLLDIGIGSGRFIKESSIPVFGFDINQVAINWLKSQNLFVDPYKSMPDVEGLTFWDSLEHIPNPNELISLMHSGQYAFISIPIFVDLIKVKESKHYRPNEHYYYFTASGLIKYMDDSGFDIIEVDQFEIEAGREDVFTFVFRKR